MYFEKDTSSSFISSKTTLIESNSFQDHIRTPSQQYNYFIHNYNTAENQVDDIILDEIPKSSLLNFFWKITRHPCALFLFLASIAIPALGLVSYIWLSASIIAYFSALKVCYRNEKNVCDPFKNMIFCPALCRITKTCNKFFEIKIDGKLIIHNHRIYKFQSCQDFLLIMIYFQSLVSREIKIVSGLWFMMGDFGISIIV